MGGRDGAGWPYQASRGWLDTGSVVTQHEPTDLLEAFGRASDGVFAIDHNMRVVYWNWAAERIFGVDAEAAMGRRCDEIVAGYETSGAVLCAPDCRIIGCSRRGHAAETYDLQRTGPDGKRQWLSVSIVVLRGRRRASTLTVHLVRDVTAHRLVEQRAADMLKQLPGTEASRGAQLTRREAEVLRMLACGSSNRAIADALGISTTTVRNHIEHLLAKLGAHSKLEAVVFAARERMI
jgi:PAS domain S-box-containing protein